LVGTRFHNFHRRPRVTVVTEPTAWHRERSEPWPMLMGIGCNFVAQVVTVFCNLDFDEARWDARDFASSGFIFTVAEP